LKFFGCKAFAHIPNEKRNKLESKSMPCVFLGYCEGSKAYRLMCVETKRIIKSRNVVFLEGTRKVEGVHDNRPLLKEGEHVVVDEVVNDDELVKDVNPISFKERLVEDVKGDKSTSNFFSEKKIATSQDEGLNEPQQDGQRERSQEQRKEWPFDEWVGAHQRGGTGHHSFFGRTSNRGRSVEWQRCQEMGDCHAKKIRLFCCQQHLVLGAIPQG
jgi:hypothetical protein